MPVNHGIKLDCSVVINRPREEIYRFWRDFRNLPRFMTSLESVSYKEDPMLTHWIAVGPLNMRLKWDAELINVHENELIAWRTIGHPDVASAGTVRFESCADPEATHVRITAEYRPPLGRFGVALAALLYEDPERKVLDDLYRLKELMETGRIRNY